MVRTFNDRVGKSDDRFLHIEEMLPEPFVGAANAPVLLLSNNPGFGNAAPLKLNCAFMNRMRDNLNHNRSHYPFIYLDPALKGPVTKWWDSKLKKLVERLGSAVVASAVLNVVYFPYPSKKFGHRRIKLPSQEYSFQLVREAMKRKAVVVLMRKGEMWFTRDAVPELNGYDRLYRVKNSQNPVISPKNCGDFEKVVEAIMAAEADSKWRWEQGPVDKSQEHIEIAYGDAATQNCAKWVPVALLSAPIGATFSVQFLLEPKDGESRMILDSVRRELNFYLNEKAEPNPWNYAIYHCSTMANVYSEVLWAYFPGPR